MPRVLETCRRQAGKIGTKPVCLFIFLSLYPFQALSNPHKLTVAYCLTHVVDVHCVHPCDLHRHVRKCVCKHICEFICLRLPIDGAYICLHSYKRAQVCMCYIKSVTHPTNPTDLIIFSAMLSLQLSTAPANTHIHAYTHSALAATNEIKLEMQK